MKREKMTKRAGFTLVELLTTLAVIAVLLGLMIPALSQVQKTAANVKQKGQFNAIGVALEAFRADTGDYPPSAFKMDISPYATASHNLAEAVVGRDGLGFHSRSQFRSDGKADIDGDTIVDQLYNAAGYGTSKGTTITTEQNLAARRGPYLELEHANAVKLQDIYPAAAFPQLNMDAYVLADMYKQLKNVRTGKQTGMPILYYKANKLKIGNDPNPIEWDKDTYNINDSFCGGLGIIAYGNHFDGDVIANASIFYNAIQNPNFPGPPARPYRAESFLLHSAGPDGLYGTPDDMFNFDQEK